MKIGNKESDGKQKTTNKSLIQWIKENPTLAKILGIVILFTLGLLVLIILVAVIVRSVTSLLSVFFGINEDKIFENEKYNEKNFHHIRLMLLFRMYNKNIYF